MNSKFVILLIENKSEDIDTIKNMLSGLGKTQMIIEVEQTLSGGIERILKGKVDVILLDLSLPDSQGMESLRKLRTESINLPVIVLTGLDDEETAIRAIAEGAQDYVCKHWINGNLLWRSIRYATERQKMIEELKKANQKILEQQKSVIEEERLKVLLQLSGATAHELNQPLMALLGNIDLLKINKDDLEKVSEYINRIERSGKRISEIVKKIQTIRYDETKSYPGDSAIINIDQKIRLLAVEDSENDYANLSQLLQSSNDIAIQRAKGIKESLHLMKKGNFDLVLLDYLLPDGNAFDLLKKLDSEKLDVPVIIITGQGDEVIASQIIQAGAYDYLPKDRISNQSLSRTLMNTLEKAQLKRQVKKAYGRMAQMSSRDELTGLYNRRYFSEALEREILRARRYKNDLVLCMADIDHFKNINDTFGHTAGDKILTEMGKILSKTIRESDLACRYGGEEFAIILSNTKVEDARTMIERFREIVAAHQFQYNSSYVQVTVSIGFAPYGNNLKQSSTEFLEKTDQALYQAKKAGRNRAVAYPGKPVWEIL